MIAPIVAGDLFGETGKILGGFGLGQGIDGFAGRWHQGSRLALGDSLLFSGEREAAKTIGKMPKKVNCPRRFNWHPGAPHLTNPVVN
jgi:hypothetical protein